MARAIQVGTKLRKADAPSYIIEVVSLVTPADGPPHARARVKVSGHDLGVRLYALSALEDTKLFVPVT